LYRTTNLVALTLSINQLMTKCLNLHLAKVFQEK
jgi:hypothetical protein